MAGARPAGGLLTAAREAPGLVGDSRPGYLQVLSRQRGFVATFVLSGMLTALALTYIYSEKYESYTTISYRVQEVTRFKAQQSDALGSPAPQAPFKVIGATLQEVLKSDAILQDVVVRLGLHEKQEPDYASMPWYQSWYTHVKEAVKHYGSRAWKFLKHGRVVEDDPVAEAVSELRGNVKVVNRDSYVFHLSVRDRYPDRAARIVDHMSKVLASWLLEYDRQPGRYRTEQLAALLESKGAEMERRRREIRDLLERNKVASVQLESERLTANLGELQLEESRLSSEIARARTRQASVEGKLATKQQALGGGVSASGAGEFIPPEDYRKLASQRLFDEVELKSLLAKREALRSSIDTGAERLRRLPGIQNQLDNLKIELAATEREYQLLKDGYAEAAVRATSPVSEVRVLHPPVVPTNPVAPIKIYHVLLAGGLGLLLAIGLVYLLDFLGIQWLFAPSARRDGVPGAPPANAGTDDASAAAHG